jgi:hypothetical protein
MMFKKKILGLFIYALPFTLLSQGLSLDNKDIPAPEARFIFKEDQQMGGVIFDKETRLEWMRCLVGQQYNAEAPTEGEKCNGSSQQLDSREAGLVTKKAGSGWRLPDAKELLEIIEWGKAAQLKYKSEILQTQKPNIFQLWGTSAHIDITGGFWTTTSCDQMNFPRVVVGKPAGTDVLNLGSEYVNTSNWKGIAYCARSEVRNSVRLVRNGSPPKALRQSNSATPATQARQTAPNKSPASKTLANSPAPEKKELPSSTEDLEGEKAVDQDLATNDGAPQKRAHISPCSRLSPGSSARVRLPGSPQAQSALVIGLAGSEADIRVMSGPSAGKKMRLHCATLR